jgi:hypothetical protein
MSSSKVPPKNIRDSQYGHGENKADRAKQETAGKQRKENRYGPKSQWSAEQNGL